MTSLDSGGSEGAAVPEITQEKYQEWKKTEEFKELLKESISMRPDIEPYLIEQVLFGYFVTDILKIPFKEPKLKKPEDLLLKTCEIFENEEAYKVAYPNVKEIQPVNLPEGKKIFEILSVEDPTIIDGTNIEDKIKDESNEEYLDRMRKVSDCDCEQCCETEENDSSKYENLIFEKRL